MWTLTILLNIVLKIIITATSIAFLYTYDELSAKDIRKTMSFYNTTKKNNIPRNKCNERGERRTTEKTMKLWWKKLQKTEIERHPVYMDW